MNITDGLKDFNTKLTAKITKRDLFIEQVNEYQTNRETLLTKMVDLEEARSIFQKASQITQEQISIHIENIVTLSLLAVNFDYEFKVNFVVRRNSTECDLLFIEDGLEMKPLDSCGYGAADIAAIALRIAFWKLSDKTRNVMMMDEPTRNLDVGRQPLAARMIKDLSKKLGLQFLIVTHNPSFADEADNLFITEKTGKVCRIKEITNV